MKLVTTAIVTPSIWEKESFFTPRDIIIIGSGLVGLWSAYELRKRFPNKSILILERGSIPTGASTRKAGFACFGSPTELLLDIKLLGLKKLKALTKLRYQGIQKIKMVLGEKNIGFEACGGYECLRHEKYDLKKLGEELEGLNKMMQEITGKSNVFVWKNDEIKKFGFKGIDGMIKNTLEGGVHTGKLMQTLLKKVESIGVTILNSVTVKSWEEMSHGVEIVTDKGRFKANKVIVAVNAFTNKITQIAKIQPARGQIIVTSPIKNLKFKGTFHYDEGYYYFRHLGNRVLLGGARNLAFKDEATSEFALTTNIQKELERFLREHLLHGEKYEIVDRWSGIMAFTEDKEPLVHLSPSQKVLTVVACNGMGVAISPMIAERIASAFGKI